MSGISLPLISDREPFLLIEKAKVCISGGYVMAVKNNRKMNIPSKQVFMLIIGTGCSITTEAAIQLSKDGCNIAYSRGGANIHTTFVSEQYKNPRKLINQVGLVSNKQHRLEIARKIVMAKLINQHVQFSASDISKAGTVEMLLGYEGAAQKNWYNNLFGEGFRRSFTGEDDYNKMINISNSVLYNFTASIITCLGYSTSIGFLHGSTRRGALALDVSDIFKPNMLRYIKHSNSKNIVRSCFDFLNKDNKNYTRHIIKTVEELCTSPL